MGLSISFRAVNQIQIHPHHNMNKIRNLIEQWNHLKISFEGLVLEKMIFKKKLSGDFSSNLWLHLHNFSVISWKIVSILTPLVMATSWSDSTQMHWMLSTRFLTRVCTEIMKGLKQETIHQNLAEAYNAILLAPQGRKWGLGDLQGTWHMTYNLAVDLSE